VEVESSSMHCNINICKAEEQLELLEGAKAAAPAMREAKTAVFMLFYFFLGLTKKK
jgi:hypothetical protein